jgi:universal stress protein A
MSNGTSTYRRMLAVIDLTEESRVLARKAQVLAETLGAELELVNVVEFVPVEPMGETLMPAVEVEEERVDYALTQLRALAVDIGLPNAMTHVEAGHVKTEILRVARERSADLIVIGSRERHGISILVNLTEDTVLHGSPCDVLAVRVGGR